MPKPLSSKPFGGAIILFDYFRRFRDKLQKLLSTSKSVSHENMPQLEFPEKHPYYIEILGDFPYYVPLPEGVILKPSRIGAEPFFVQLEHFVPKRHPEESRGENVDDRMGTYIRSRARLLFPLAKYPDEPDWESYEQKSLVIVNRLIESVRYLAFDHTVRRVIAFDRTVFRSWKLNENGTSEPAGVWQEKHSYGPFGVRLLGRLSEDKLQELWWHFNSLAPTNPAWHLVLDAKFHNQTGDVSRAILDLATALEINVPNLIDHFGKTNPELRELDIDTSSIYSLYDDVLKEATGHSLHEEPSLFSSLEYIRAVRNSIAHDWEPVFKISLSMEKTSKYLEIHRPKDEHEIKGHNEVDELVEQSIEIIKHTTGLFQKRFRG